MKTVVLFLGALLILTGCASLSREQCQRGDWYGLGMADGRAGEAASRLDQHFRACSEYGILVDDQQYLNGHAQGLVDYCQIDNAVDTGLQGRRYQHVCPPAIDAAFDRYNRAAYEVYRIRRELDNVDDQIINKEYRLRDKAFSDDSRRQLRFDIRELDLRRDRLRDDLYSSERYLDRLLDDVGSYRSP